MGPGWPSYALHSSLNTGVHELWLTVTNVLQGAIVGKDQCQLGADAAIPLHVPRAAQYVEIRVLVNEQEERHGSR